MANKHNFEAETGRILELLTHSIYSNKEIFLREIISNSSDAIDKARIESLTDTSYLKEGEEFEIRVSIDKENNAIIVEDNGIGMTKQELQKNLWTIAKSGTKEFVDKLKKAKEDWEHNLIGQFWVGFYSSFMVADSVEVDSKTNTSENASKWISDGKTGYEIKIGTRKTRGTTIKMFLNEANKELLEEWKLKELIKKYSNYAPVAIMLEVEEKEEIEVDGKKEEKIVWKKWERVNESKAIWKKQKSEIKKEELDEFYKSISMDFNEPLTHSLSNVEGMVSYKSLLFVPKEKNMFADMTDPNKEYGPRLYIQNVLILENAKELLPVWLRFVSWVVETTDLPLNISREMLQSNPTLDKIKKGLIKKVLTELKKSMKKDSESSSEWQSDYDKFYNNFGQVLKEWIHYEADLKEEIAWVIKFKSMINNKLISLEEYIENFSSEEKVIYFITWKSEAEVLSSPYLAQFRETNTDVLLLTDPIDAFIMQAISEFKWTKFKTITSSDIKLKEETKEEVEKKEKTKKSYKEFLEFTKNSIGNDIIEKVELNNNLWDAIWALRTPEGWVNPQMEKMMKAMGQAVPVQKRILELNPNTKLVKAMKKEFSTDLKSRKLKSLMDYAYNQAVLLEGWELKDMSEFISMTNKFAGEYIK